MYRTIARLEAEPDDTKRLWDETKAEVRRRRLDERLRFLTGAPSQSVRDTDPKAAVVVAETAKPEITPDFRDWAFRVIWDLCLAFGTVYFVIWVFENITVGWVLAIGMLVLSLSFLLAGMAVERGVLEIRRYGKLRNRLPVASLATLVAGGIAWWNAIWWSDLHKEAIDLGFGSSGLQLLEMALWVGMALIAAFRGEWTPANGPDTETRFDAPEALNP